MMIEQEREGFLIEGVMGNAGEKGWHSGRVSEASAEERVMVGEGDGGWWVVEESGSEEDSQPILKN